MRANFPNRPFELFAVIRPIRKKNEEKEVLFARAFHPFQKLRKIPDLKIRSHLPLFQIDFPVLEMEGALEELDRAVRETVDEGIYFPGILLAEGLAL
jgi:hypothetical protein